MIDQTEIFAPGSSPSCRAGARRQHGDVEPRRRQPRALRRAMHRLGPPGGRTARGPERSDHPAAADLGPVRRRTRGARPEQRDGGGALEVSCDQGFLSYLSTCNDQTGEVEFIEALTTVAGSTLIEPVGTVPPPGPVRIRSRRPATPLVFTRSGEIVRYPSTNNGLCQLPGQYAVQRQPRVQQAHGRLRLPHRHLGPDQQLRLPLHLLAQQRLELEQHVRLREHPRLAQHDGLPGQRDRRRLDGAALRRLAAAGRQLPHALRVRPRRGHRLLPRHRRRRQHGRHPRLQHPRHDLLHRPLLHRVRLPARLRGPRGLHSGLDLLNLQAVFIP